MSDSRPPNTADDPEDSPKPENAAASSQDPTPAKDAENLATPEKKTATDEQTTPAADNAADKSPAEDSSALANEETAATGEVEAESTGTPDVDLEGVRAATMISMSGGPKPSRLKWALINLFIKLFKLTARFFPALLMLGGLSYSYIHFFGAPPVIDKLMSTPTMQRITSNSTVEAVLDKVGVEVLTLEEREKAAAEKPKSKVDQMLQQTRDVVAASNSRVNLGNALAEGDFQEIEDMVAAVEAAEEGDGSESEGDSSETDGTPDPLTAGAQAVVLPEPVSVSTYAGSNAEWAKLREEADGAAAVAELLGEEIAEPEAPPREVIYRSEVPPSDAFRKWVQDVQIGGALPGDDPKALINRMTFRPGETVDYNLRITFEGFAKDDTLLVFRDANNAYLTVIH
ncbi:MAG: hypothetical protein HOH58_10265 [Opitutaceae bacterium]|nr:hypothetical protein [Opitutaceae bacterium]